MSRMASAILLVASSSRFSVCPATRLCQILLTTPASVTFIASFLPLPPPGATPEFYRPAAVNIKSIPDFKMVARAGHRDGGMGLVTGYPPHTSSNTRR